MKLLLLATVLTLVVIASCAPAATPAPPAPAPTTGATAAPRQQATPKPKETTPAPTRTTAPVKPPEPKQSIPYFQGKTIEILVSSSAGGGTDTLARIAGPFFTRYLPGNPRVVIRNQGGGAGTIANNIFVEKAAPNGLFLIQNSTSPINMQLRSPELARYDITKYRNIASVSRAGEIVLTRKGVRNRLNDPNAKPLFIGTQAGEESWHAILLWGREFLGWNVKWISGFGGTSEMELAFRRGELDIYGGSNAFVIRRLVAEGVGDTWVALGGLKGNQFTRRSDFPDVPSFVEVLGDKKPTGLPWQAFTAWLMPKMVDKFLSAPPGTPDNIMAMLVDAFTRMSKDPEFDRTVKKQVNEVYDVVTGKDLDDLIRDALSAPPEAMDYGRSLQTKFGMVSK